MTRVEIIPYESASEAIMAIRFAVFVDEQGVDPQLEIDGLDPKCLHVLAYDDGVPIGTGRIQEDGHIGRVAVLPSHRGAGIGTRIMETLMDAAKGFGCQNLWLSSQTRAIPFYERLGFAQEGSIYVEAGIDHIKMRRKLTLD